MRRLLLTGACLFFAACVDGPTHPGLRSSVPSLEQGVRPVAITIDDVFADIARHHVPGFAGHYFDENGAAVVLLTDLGQAETAKSLVAARLQRAPVQSRGPIQVRQADFDYVQLKQWYDALRPALRPVPGVVSFDIDENDNRIRIGTDPLLAPGDVRARLAELGIPAEAVIVEVGDRFVLTGSPDMPALNERAWPMEGGRQIARSDGKTCTLGFNANKNGWRGFITAAHCSWYPYPDTTKICDGTNCDNTMWWNPVYDVAVAELAIEREDVKPWDCDPDPSITIKCREADAAFMTYRHLRLDSLGKSGPPTWNGQGLRGFIARPADQSGTKELNTSNPRFDAIGEAGGESDIQQGQTLHKVGAGTGWSSGPVAQTCVEHLIDDVWYICQKVVEGVAGAGDSGAPVFYHDGANGATIAGILVAACDANLKNVGGCNKPKFSVTSLYYIQLFFGDLQTGYQGQDPTTTKFYAWSSDASLISSSRIPLFLAGSSMDLDPRWDRQYIAVDKCNRSGDGFTTDMSGLYDFIVVKGNKGHRYVLGDEPDNPGGCPNAIHATAEEYAQEFFEVADSTRKMDSLATFSTAGFSNVGWIPYARKFKDAYATKNGPPIAEYRFNIFGDQGTSLDSMQVWRKNVVAAKKFVQDEAGSTFILGAFGFPHNPSYPYPDQKTDVRSAMAEMFDFIKVEKIPAAYWYRYEENLDRIKCAEPGTDPLVKGNCWNHLATSGGAATIHGTAFQILAGLVK